MVETRRNKLRAIACRNFDLDLWKRSHDTDATAEAHNLARAVLSAGAPVIVPRLDDSRSGEIGIKRMD